MQQMTIELPTTIINALAAYSQEHEASSSDTVQTALESFLVAKGYLAKPKKSFYLSPAPKESGYTDTSINHEIVTRLYGLTDAERTIIKDRGK